MYGRKMHPLWNVPHKLKELSEEQLKRKINSDRLYGKIRTYVDNGKVHQSDASDYFYIYGLLMKKVTSFTGRPKSEEEWLKEMPKAAGHLLTGAQLEHPGAMGTAALAFYYGDAFFPQDKKKAMEYLRKGVENRSNTCILILASIYKSEGKEFKSVLNKMTRELDKPFQVGLIYVHKLQSYIDEKKMWR